jgi:hypothetical protein
VYVCVPFYLHAPSPPLRIVVTNTRSVTGVSEPRFTNIWTGWENLAAWCTYVRLSSIRNQYTRPSCYCKTKNTDKLIAVHTSGLPQRCRSHTKRCRALLPFHEALVRVSGASRRWFPVVLPMNKLRDTWYRFNRPHQVPTVALDVLGISLKLSRCLVLVSTWRRNSYTHIIRNRASVVVAEVS